MLIIHPQPNQWKMYRKIRLAALKEDPQAFGRFFKEEKTYSKEKWLERVNNDYSLLALENNKPIGIISAYITEEKNNKVAHVVSVFVLKEARGRGVGEKLLNTVLEKIKKDPTIKKVVLSVNKEQIPAVKLYQKFGFEIIGQKPEQLGDGKKHIEYEMELSLK